MKKAMIGLTLAAMLATTTAAHGRRIISYSSYGPYPEQTDQVCMPSVPPVAAIVAVHGGGWVQGNHGGMNYTCTFFSGFNIAVLNIDYRLAPDAKWPAQLQDTQLAIRSAHQQWPGIPVGVMGLSAGGHIALMAGATLGLMVNSSTDPLNEAALLPGLSSRPDFVISVSGPIDLCCILKPDVVQLIAPDAPYGREQASPIVIMDGSMPHAWLSYGSNDPVVPPAQAIALANDCARLQDDCTLTMTAGGHIWNGLTSDQIAAYYNQMLNWIYSLTPPAQR